MAIYLDVPANLFYPQYCVGRSRRASDVLCGACFEALPIVVRPFCGRCGAPTAFEVYGCGECQDKVLRSTAHGSLCGTRTSVKSWCMPSSRRGTRAWSRR